MTNQSDISTPSEVVEQPEKREPLGVFFWICVGWLVLTALSALVGPLLVEPLHWLKDPNAMLSNPGEPISFSHPMGTDQLGRDIFARVVIGTRISLGISLGAMAIGFGVGG
ncbi:MAG: hypothetical protein KJS64_07385, partial [Acidobacteria bacterium]|nr:hypothetical protein [Acidobacteriota bacterium]